MGVLIDDNLSFNEHDSNLCVKAAWQANALRRIIKTPQMNVALMFIRQIYPQIQTIVILSGILVAIVAWIWEPSGHI